MASHFRLQDLLSLPDGAHVQDPHDAIDVGSFKTLVVQVRKPALAATTGMLTLEHAAVNVEDAFTEINSNKRFSLTANGNEVMVYVDVLRFVRWATTTDVSGGPAKIIIDVIARET